MSAKIFCIFELYMAFDKISSAARSILPLFTLLIFFGCSGKLKKDKMEVYLPVENALIKFSADSAYSFIETQLDFGYRVPGTVTHDSCAVWIESKINQYVDTVEIQKGIVTAFNGDKLPITNIFGKLNPKAKERVLFIAHYDTRPWADEEKEADKINKPIPGANDGASGVAVMLELARVLRANGYQGGVDFLFVDAEDYGMPDSQNNGTVDSESTWCLGTQYWIENRMPFLDQLPVNAVLLDMVGGKNAKFHPELISKLNAPQLVESIWTKAIESGYGDFFVKTDGNGITDDHLFFLRAGIPAIDIIENNNPETGSFNPRWHTLKDNIEGIDKKTLEAVGSTLQAWITER